MALTYVQSAEDLASNGSTATVAVALAGVVAGHLIAAFVVFEDAPTTTISVSDGTTSFTGATKRVHSDTTHTCQWFYLLSSVASGSVTYTATLGAARTVVHIRVFEYSYTGALTFDQENSAESAGGTTALTTGNITTTGTDEVVLAGWVAGGGMSSSAEQINGVAATHALADGAGGKAWDRIATATFTGQGTATTTSTTWLSAIVSIKSNVGGGATVALEWKSPATQLQNHFVTSIINMQAVSSVPLPYLPTTPTRVTNPLDWVQVSPDVIWTES